MLWLILLIVAVVVAYCGSRDDNDGATIAGVLLAIVYIIVFVLRLVAIGFWI